MPIKIREKTINYKGTKIHYFHKPDGVVVFNTKDITAILGAELLNKLQSYEFLRVEYQMTVMYAKLLNKDFANWLQEKFQDD